MIGSIDRRAVRLRTALFVTTLFSVDIIGAGEPGKSASSRTLLAEARSAASTILDSTDRSHALEQILVAQIALDPAGARETLKTFPNLPNRPDHFASLAAAYANAGNIDEAEHMYAEIRIQDRSSRQGKVAAADARGSIAIAYANAGKMEDSFRMVSQLRDQYREVPPALIGTVIASTAETQAKHGDIAGAVKTAVTIAGENPHCLMNIVGGRVRARDLPGALKIVSQLDEGLQRYAQWGIVQAQKEQGLLTEAQLTASAMKPGHAKASALLELANHHIKVGAGSVAANLLQEAAMAAGSTVNDRARADVLWHISAAMAEARETFTALETAKAIEKEGHRKLAIHDIVKAQARQGDVKGAFNNALLLKRENDAGGDGAGSYETAVSDILAEQTKFGHAKEARDAVKNFEDLKPRHRLLYARIAAAQAEGGDIHGAQSTLLLAETPQQRAAKKKDLLHLTQMPLEHLNEENLHRLEELRDRDRAVALTLNAIAKAQAKKGDLRSAVETAHGLTNRSDRSKLFQEIGAIQVQTGRTSQALIWARALPSQSDKAYALLGIAQALGASKSKPTLKP